MLQNVRRHMSVTALFLSAALGLSVGSALAADRTVNKVSSTSDGYCHLKIPALRRSTLTTDKPELKTSATGDMIDFYGPCNYDPAGNDAVTEQRRLLRIKYHKQ